jgi:hypothetical protein
MNKMSDDQLSLAMAALIKLENACDQLASVRSHRVYDAMIEDGNGDALAYLDEARREARTLILVDLQAGDSGEGDLTLDQELTTQRASVMDVSNLIMGNPAPALTTLFYEVCDADRDRFNDAARLMTLFMIAAKECVASELSVDGVVSNTVDPFVTVQGAPVPALTTMIHRICKGDERKFETACRLADLFIAKAAEITTAQQEAVAALSNSTRPR